MYDLGREKVRTACRGPGQVSMVMGWADCVAGEALGRVLPGRGGMGRALTRRAWEDGPGSPGPGGAAGRLRQRGGHWAGPEARTRAWGRADSPAGEGRCWRCAGITGAAIASREPRPPPEHRGGGC